MLRIQAKVLPTNVMQSKIAGISQGNVLVSAMGVKVLEHSRLN